VPAQLYAELLALRTTRAPWALAAAAAALTLGLALPAVLDAGKDGAPSIGTAGALLAVLGAAGPGSVVALLVGVLAVTGEFRHGTVTAACLRAPIRWRVLEAKAGAVALVATGVALVDLAVVLAVGLPSGAVAPDMLNADIVLREAGLLLAYPLYGALGVGVGALLLSQPLAVVLPVAWLVFVEDLALRLAPPGLAPWSLGGVSAALANSPTLARALPVWAGGAALAGYVVVAWSMGALRMTRRSIT
jgi:ABC-2 type transport system permease protein